MPIDLSAIQIPQNGEFVIIDLSAIVSPQNVDSLLSITKSKQMGTIPCPQNGDTDVQIPLTVVDLIIDVQDG